MNEMNEMIETEEMNEMNETGLVDCNADCQEIKWSFWIEVKTFNLLILTRPHLGLTWAPLRPHLGLTWAPFYLKINFTMHCDLVRLHLLYKTCWVEFTLGRLDSTTKCIDSTCCTGPDNAID